MPVLLAGHQTELKDHMRVSWCACLPPRVWGRYQIILLSERVWETCLEILRSGALAGSRTRAIATNVNPKPLQYTDTPALFLSAFTFTVCEEWTKCGCCRHAFGRRNSSPVRGCYLINRYAVLISRHVRAKTISDWWYQGVIIELWAQNHTVSLRLNQVRFVKGKKTSEA